MTFKKVIHDGEILVYINNSGYKHAPYLLTWVDSYETCGSGLYDRNQLQQIWTSLEKDIEEIDKALGFDREKIAEIPDNLKNYPLTPDECFKTK